MATVTQLWKLFSRLSFIVCATSLLLKMSTIAAIHLPNEYNNIRRWNAAEIYEIEWAFILAHLDHCMNLETLC